MLWLVSPPSKDWEMSRVTCPKPFEEPAPLFIEESLPPSMKAKIWGKRPVSVDYNRTWLDVMLQCLHCTQHQFLMWFCLQILQSVLSSKGFKEVLTLLNLSFVQFVLYWYNDAAFSFVQTLQHGPFSFAQLDYTGLVKSSKYAQRKALCLYPCAFVTSAGRILS